MIRISSDSTCDLGHLVQKHNVSIMPLKVVLDAETYYDGLNISPQEIFAFVKKTNMLPKTAAASEHEFLEYFAKLTENGDEVVHFDISSKASVTNSNAQKAAQEFDGKVRVIDTKALSSGQGLLVMKAVDMAEAGASAAEIEETVNALRDKVNTSFVPDSLDYLYKGGRVSGMVKFAANLLKIHPMIYMQDGQLVSGKKYKGKMNVLIKQYVEDLKAMYPSYDKTRCFITHSSADQDLVDAAKAAVAEAFDFEEVIETVAGSVITGHCGRNTLGVLFICK